MITWVTLFLIQVTRVVEFKKLDEEPLPINVYRIIGSTHWPKDLLIFIPKFERKEKKKGKEIKNPRNILCMYVCMKV